MAEEEVVSNGSGENGGSKKKKSMLLVIVLVLVGLALAGGISYFVTTKIVSTSNVSAPIKKEPGVFVKIGDPKDGTIIVNVGGVKSGRYLKVGVVLEMNPADEVNFKEHKITDAAQSKVLDAVMSTFRKQGIEQLEASNEDKLKEAIKNEVNAAIGDGSVYNVYITSFVLQ
ncbi:flagellar basal body-associated FliL family protein [Pectinatus haikarae]|uniref:Flagellar protein FliL n=1 Tax=Pectinatus haikarae TaxID=349096 RepID=A0ABT9Y9B3_9FIRM|nr:flagellar basal body-associated FliL family protein [Pectinatus haikarae]MDQ0203772.1 flagellar FliL protein [Pectinatus haikarae]